MAEKLVMILVGLVFLISCRQEPKGAEVTINQLIEFHSEGKIQEFTFISAGSWIVAELTTEALDSDRFKPLLDYAISQGSINNKTEFRLVAKVISLESFKEKLEREMGTQVEIRVQE